MVKHYNLARYIHDIILSTYPPTTRNPCGFFLGQDSVARPGMAGGLDGGGKVRGGGWVEGVFFFARSNVMMRRNGESRKRWDFFMDFPY